MRCYLAGKMSGEPYFNFPAFHAAAAKLREQGYEVFNPAETDNEAVKERGGIGWRWVNAAVERLVNDG